MYYYKNEDGSIISYYKRIDGLEEITKEDYNILMDNVIKGIESSQNEPTAEERLEAIESALLELMGVDVDG